jgi:hypothetical protein
MEAQIRMISRVIATLTEVKNLRTAFMGRILS